MDLSRLDRMEKRELWSVLVQHRVFLSLEGSSVETLRDVLRTVLLEVGRSAAANEPLVYRISRYPPLVKCSGNGSGRDDGKGNMVSVALFMASHRLHLLSFVPALEEGAGGSIVHQSMDLATHVWKRHPSADGRLPGDPLLWSRTPLVVTDGGRHHHLRYIVFKHPTGQVACVYSFDSRNGAWRHLADHFEPLHPDARCSVVGQGNRLVAVSAVASERTFRVWSFDLLLPGNGWRMVHSGSCSIGVFVASSVCAAQDDLWVMMSPGRAARLNLVTFAWTEVALQQPDRIPDGLHDPRVAISSLRYHPGSHSLWGYCKEFLIRLDLATCTWSYPPTKGRLPHHTETRYPNGSLVHGDRLYVLAGSKLARHHLLIMDLVSPPPLAPFPDPRLAQLYVEHRVEGFIERSLQRRGRIACIPQHMYEPLRRIGILDRLRPGQRSRPLDLNLLALQMMVDFCYDQWTPAKFMRDYPGVSLLAILHEAHSVGVHNFVEFTVEQWVVLAEQPGSDPKMLYAICDAFGYLREPALDRLVGRVVYLFLLHMASGAIDMNAPEFSKLSQNGMLAELQRITASDPDQLRSPLPRGIHLLSNFWFTAQPH